MEYSIAEVSRMTNLSPYTLRYYDKEGLLPFVARDSLGSRVFNDEDLEMIHIICCLKDTGMPIKQIKAFIDLQMSGNSTLHERRDMMLEHQKYVNEQIEAFQRNLKLIDHKLSYYEDACKAYDSGKPIPCCCNYSEEQKIAK